MTFEGKKVVVLGGTGSLGGALVERLILGRNGRPAHVTIMSRDEAKQHDYRHRWRRLYAATLRGHGIDMERWLTFQIGDVRNLHDVVRAVDKHDIAIFAAALKQVPSCEYFPEQAVLTNCIGAINVVKAIQEYHLPVETAVGVSTDKACEPINVMGMTKALQERIFTAANMHSHGTRFVCVRYGNVMGTRGSVIPLFLEQIAHGSPITMTDRTMTRFLLSLNDAVDTIVAAIDHAKRGEIAVPSAPAADLGTLVEALTDGVDVQVTTIGMRPGERPHEMMVSEEEAKRTEARNGHLFIRPMLPELVDEEMGAPALDGALTSETVCLSVRDTQTLLSDNGLIEPRKAALRVLP